jgi:hypothetical protein
VELITELIVTEKKETDIQLGIEPSSFKLQFRGGSRNFNMVGLQV